jgi:preprotein translocase subunit SecE
MAKETATKSAAKPQGRLAGAAKAAKTLQRPQGSAPPRKGRFRRFLREVRIEMSKVTWPPRSEVVQATGVVLVAVVVASAYIGLFDLLWSTLVSLARLG